MRAPWTVDDDEDNACDPQAVHCPSKNLAAVESSGGIDKKGCDYEERGDHDQHRREPLRAVKRLTVGQCNVDDSGDEEQQVTGSEDQARHAIQVRNRGDVAHVLAGEGERRSGPVVPPPNVRVTKSLVLLG